MSGNGSQSPRRPSRSPVPFRPWEDAQTPEDRARRAIQQELEGIIQRYFDEAISKTAAVREITSNIGRACEQRGIAYSDAMLELWLLQIDAHEASLADAANRGRQQGCRSLSPHAGSRGRAGSQRRSRSPTRRQPRSPGRRRSRSHSRRGSRR